MILPDVNVLIYAFRKDSPEHGLCRNWLEGVVSSDPHFAISPLALAALVRITTSHRLQPSTSSRDEAFAFCDAILAQPNCQIVEPGPRHWDIFRRLCAQADIRGSRITDAWYAALAMEWGCEWITMDRDFARFRDLKWSVPTA
jgi:toxin-antitoxin system PIN domain toxin